MASAKLRDLQIRLDLEIGDVVCVRWRGLEREVLLEAEAAAADTKARLQALFDRLYPPPPDAIEV